MNLVSLCTFMLQFFFILADLPVAIVLIALGGTWWQSVRSLAVLLLVRVLLFNGVGSGHLCDGDVSFSRRFANDISSLVGKGSPISGSRSGISSSLLGGDEDCGEGRQKKVLEGNHDGNIL
jgi:hypothetical protein